jgi:chorismate mutase
MSLQNARALLDSLAANSGRPGEEESVDELQALRSQIDVLDEAILALLNERSRCANEIGRVKKTRALSVYDPAREKEVISKVVNSNEGPLPDGAARRLFERIIDETRSLERHLYQAGIVMADPEPPQESD